MRFKDSEHLDVRFFHITIKIASEVGAQMKLRFLNLMLHMLNFGNNSVERSRSAVAIGLLTHPISRQQT